MREDLRQSVLGTSIVGDEKLPNADDFFNKVRSETVFLFNLLQVMLISGAHISWPSKLKIGAKTKKGEKDEQ